MFRMMRYALSLALPVLLCVVLPSMAAADGASDSLQVTVEWTYDTGG